VEDDGAMSCSIALDFKRLQQWPGHINSLSAVLLTPLAMRE
jgi:hypothetical protein